jgi:pilus assembly protein CpaB
MIVISIVLGLVAVLIAARWVTQQAFSVNVNKMAVAARDIDVGTRLAPEMVKVVDWPSGSMPQGAFSDFKQLQDPQTQEARVLKQGVQKGEPILEYKLTPAGTKGGLSAVINEGKRAITVRVNDVIGVAGFALPGNYVDILVNTIDETAHGQGKEKSISKIVLEHILVLAAAQEVSQSETKPKVVNAVTLEVTPKDAEKIDLARSVGSLSLVLRNQMDTNTTVTTGMTKQELLRGVPERQDVVKEGAATEKKVAVHRRAATPKKQPGALVEVIRGTTITRHEFKAD